MLTRLVTDTMRRSTRHAPRQWPEDLVFEEFDAVEAFAARADTSEHPWLRFTSKKSQQALEAADRRGVGFFRAVSHPFFGEKGHDLLTEIKWLGFPDNVYVVRKFAAICEEFNRRPLFLEALTKWSHSDEDARVRKAMEKLLTSLPASEPLTLRLNPTLP